ncbi:hypothetical protein COB55_05755 [Candidatus Wolfebacteria bacterium]|nr:MAG: hypothetical protein COB55_05755 [Candidatus Wolfebacteria bacterium]
MKKAMRDIFYNTRSKYFLIVNNFLAALTLVSVLSIILNTVAALDSYNTIFITIEYAATLFFTIEYIGRIIANQKKPLTYIFSFFGIIDLLSIVPSYMGLFNLTYLKSARMFRILRFLRTLRLIKLTKKGNIKSGTLLEEEDLLHGYKLRIYIFSLLTSVVIAGSLIFIAEWPREQFANIPLSMIWSAKVILGGVPQIVPETLFGELVTIMTRFTGLLLFGLLINVVGSGLQKLLFGDTKSKK